MIGAYCEEFIGELMKRNILLDNIHSESGIVYADINAAHYPAAARISRRFGVRIRVESRKGLYFRIRPFRKRPGLIIGTLFSVAAVLTLRMFVWHIDIHGNSQLSDDYMLGLLEQYGFTAGVFANNTDALDAERRIMLSSDIIKWINIEVNGSRADVYMSEKSSDDRAVPDMKTPCNIVAARSGIITDTNVSSGKLMYEKGSGVAEGSVIVSGFVSSGDALITVHSDAEIIAEFTETQEFSMNYTTVEKVPTDSTFTHRQLMLLGIVIPLDGNDSDTENTICTESSEKLRLFGFELPAAIKTENYRRYGETTVTRSADDVRRLLEQQLELYIQNFLGDYEVLDVSKSFSETNDGLVLNARIKLKGDIGVKKPIYEH